MHTQNLATVEGGARDLNDLYSQHRGQFSQRFAGFQCGSGWARLIDSTLSELATDCPESRIVQVKEKFGGLRIYLEDKTDEPAKAILRRAEDLSFSVCELCGMPGERIASGGWVRVRCGTHREH